MHKLNGFSDPTDSFLVRKLLIGLCRKHASFDLRLPITCEILQCINIAFPTVCSCYNRSLFSAMFLLAFAAFLRVGEMTTTGKGDDNNIMFQGVSVDANNTLKITFYHYKHRYLGSPHMRDLWLVRYQRSSTTYIYEVIPLVHCSY